MRNLSFKVEDLSLPPGVENARADARLGLLGSMRQDFLSSHPGIGPLSHQDAYQRAVRLMRSAAAKAFELEEESAAVRDAYGRTAFGQGCLLARRLVERGVPFVEVTLSSADGPAAVGWDTHQQNFEAVKRLSGVLDPAWSALMDDLRTRGLLDSTLDRLDGRVRPYSQDQSTGGSRPLPRGLDHRPRWRRYQRGPGHRQLRRRWDAGQGPPGVGPRLFGDGLQRVGRRPHGSKRFRSRPADPDRGPEGQSHPGGARMSSRSGLVGPGRGGGVRACVSAASSCGRQRSTHPDSSAPTAMPSRM